jgi:hypothetical protein
MVADIISYDKKVQTYTYKEVLHLIDKGESFSNFKMIKKEAVSYWVKKDECCFL